MDPRLRMVLMTLLELALDGQVRKEEKRLPKPDEEGRDQRYWLRQLQPPGTHVTKPQFSQVTNFGNA